MKRFLPLVFVALALNSSIAQDDLLDLIDKESEEESAFTEQTFKGTRLINGHSIETRQKGVLDVIIGHRFGRLNSGAYELFGLDESNVRLGVDFGLTDNMNLGLGRNSFEKTYDGFFKYKFLRQQPGSVPISVAGFSSIALKTLRTGDPTGEQDASSRLTFS